MANLRDSSGYSLLELLFVVGLIATIAGAAVPGVLAGLEDVRTRGAVRYVSGRLQAARMEAVSRGANTAVQFSPAGESYRFAVYVDGNGDGVRTADIQQGIDRQTQRDERLVDQFPGVEFAILPDLPAVDASSDPPGGDPIRSGSGDLITFTSAGTATPGSLYILGRQRTQYVIRVFGETGKVRTLKFNHQADRWEPL